MDHDVINVPTVCQCFNGTNLKSMVFSFLFPFPLCVFQACVEKKRADCDHLVGHHVQSQKRPRRKCILFGSDTSSTIERHRILARVVVVVVAAMPQKGIEIRCDQTPSSNQGLQTKRGNCTLWFCYR